MDYKVNWDGGVFAVPDAAADCLKLIPSKAAKVLLYIMRYKELPQDPSLMGENFTAEDIEEAVNCWVQAGVLYKDGNAPAAAVKAQTKCDNKNEVKILAAPPVKTAEPLRETKTVIKQQKALLPTEITARIADSEEVAFLFKSAECSLKRVLTFDDQRTILWIYDHLGLSADIITMLIAFCCSIDRPSMAFIERAALDWHEKNITTHEQAENEILFMQKRHTFEGQVQSRLKLPPKLTASQKKYISQWAMWDMDIDTVELAYDKTVDSTGKLSFSYMNKILEKWHDNNITSAAEAASFDDRTKPSVQKNAKQAADTKQQEQPSFDLSAILEHAINNTPTV